MGRTILVVKTSSLGDVIHNMPAVTDIARHWPDARIDWAVEEAYVPLVALHRHVDRVIPVGLRRWRRAPTRPANWREFAQLRRTLAERRYDTVIDTQGLIKSAMLVRLASGKRVGFDRVSVREPLAARAYDRVVAVDRSLHATERCRRLCAAALGFAPAGPLDYGLSVVRTAGSRRALLVHGTARPEKAWPEDCWEGIGQELAARGWRIELLHGSDAEAARSARLAAAIPNAKVHPRLSLDAVARTMAEFALAIGVDTGLLHLAAALEVPVAAIFGATDPALTGPRGRGPIEVCGGRAGFPSVAAVVGASERLAPALAK